MSENMKRTMATDEFMHEVFGVEPKTLTEEDMKIIFDAGIFKTLNDSFESTLNEQDINWKNQKIKSFYKFAMIPVIHYLYFNKMASDELGTAKAQTLHKNANEKTTKFFDLFLDTIKKTNSNYDGV